MRKGIFFIVLFLVFNYTIPLLAQPLPNDSPFSSANGPKPVGGGADLGQQVTILVVFALIYMFYKYRIRIFQWFGSLDIRLRSSYSFCILLSLFLSLILTDKVILS